MCNPPFYTSRDELIKSAEEKKRVPFSVSATGSSLPLNNYHTLYAAI
jgi:23S rRNA (adenine1618-N6)-methyltransferase